MSQISSHNLQSAFDQRYGRHQSIHSDLKPVPPLLIDCFDQLPSTSRHLMAHYQQSGHNRQCVHICATAEQTAGVGRQGRQWLSSDQCITFSVLLPVELTFDHLGGFSLALGVTLAEYLQTLVSPTLALKWPNDVLAGDQKLSGILIESVGSPVCLLVGIGINYSADSQLVEQVARPLTTLRQLHADSDPDCRAIDLPSRDRVMGELLADVLVTTHQFQCTGWQGFAHRYALLDALYGSSVTINTGGDSVEGIARGVADNGNLLVDVRGSRRSFAAGEVSLSHALHPAS